MSGPANWETILWIIGIMGSGIGAAFTVWFFINRTIKTEVHGLKEDMGVRVSAASAQASLTANALAEFRSEVAREYVRKDDGALGQIAEGVREIRADMRTMNARIDGLADRTK